MRRLKGRVGSTEVTFKGWGRVKYPVGYKKHNNVGVKGQDIALPFPPHWVYILLTERIILKETCHQDNLLKPSTPQT